MSDQERQASTVKECETAFLEFIELLEMSGADKRWLAIAKTHIQQATMAAVRAVHNPVKN